MRAKRPTATKTLLSRVPQTEPAVTPLLRVLVTFAQVASLKASTNHKTVVDVNLTLPDCVKT